MLGATRRTAISDADSAELTERFASMPPHPEVPAALRRLRDHGFRLFTLTDNTLKPAPDAYHSVADELDVDPGDICLVACHAWDTLGAVAAGWGAALIVREGNARLDVGPQPNYIGADLDAITDQLIAHYPAQATIDD
jgi:2-haloacid dehalogenase